MKKIIIRLALFKMGQITNSIGGPLNQKFKSLIHCAVLKAWFNDNKT